MRFRTIRTRNADNETHQASNRTRTHGTVDCSRVVVASKEERTFHSSDNAKHLKRFQCCNATLFRALCTTPDSEVVQVRFTEGEKAIVLPAHFRCGY